ncbi:GNAT family N-acetyltransferase [Arcticibacter sp.]|jgi:biotin operon repressor|uniref:GNAT family N-acetyltransferase n=1 Tax=Arcticibacter sp. TaxID=1872630 RepID=UPI00388D4CD1
MLFYPASNRLHVLTIDQKSEWRDVINRSFHYDFYHTWYYHSLDKSGEPILLIYENGGDFIAFPFVKRRKGLSDKSLGAAYGYTGPVSSKRFQDWDVKELETFDAGFLTFLRDGEYHSVTTRLHPFIDQTRLLERLGGEFKEGKSVAIDLSISIDEQRKSYRRSLWAGIEKLRRKGCYVKEGGADDIHTFISIYWENMRRIGADDVYLFNEQYFFDFMASEDFDVKLFFVFSGTEPICASMVTFTNGVIQGYLIGTREQYLSESPAKFLIDQVSVFGREHGMRYYNLGGGLNFEQDQLFHWKLGFSRLCLNSNKWTFSPFNGAQTFIGFISNLCLLHW